jgi:hypothetical protein
VTSDKPSPRIPVFAHHSSLITRHRPSALLGRDGEEGGKSLLDLLPFALGTGESGFFVFGQTHGQGKGLLTIFAGKFVHWHKVNPPSGVGSIVADPIG